MSDEGPERRRLPRNVVALGAVSFLMDASTEMIRPVFPLLLSNVLGASASLIGLIEGLADSASSLLKIIAGWLSDKLGKRKALIVFGYGASAVAKPLIALAGSAYTVMGLWLFDRTGKGVRGAPRDAIIADSTPEKSRGRAYGLHRTMDTAGAVLGPLLAMLLLWWAASRDWSDARTYRSVFWLAAIPGIVAVIVAAAFVRERRTASARAARERRGNGLGGRFAALVAVLTVFTLGNSADAFLFLRSKDLGLAVIWIPGLYLVMNVIYAGTSHWFGSLSDRIGRKPLVVGGFLVYAAAYAGLALARTHLLLWPLFAIYGLYYGMADGTTRALVSDLVPAGARATAFGIYQGVTGLALLPASVIMGALYDRFAGGAFFLGAALALVAAVGILIVAPGKHRPADAAEQV